MRSFVFLTALLGLAACGGDTETQQQVAFDRANAALQMVEKVESFDPTQINRMPTSGSATFDGYATLRVSTVPLTEDDDILMLGVSHLEVRFDQPGPVTGTASDFDAIVPGIVSSEL